MENNSNHALFAIAVLSLLFPGHWQFAYERLEEANMGNAPQGRLVNLKLLMLIAAVV